MSQGSPSRGSPSPAPSESFSVLESVWTREQDSQGRVYFFNRATGASQWHIPNDLYKARVFEKEPVWEDVQKMPGSARAILKNDCVTEVPKAARSSTADALKAQIFARMGRKGRSFEAEDEEPVVKPQPLLKVTLVKARDLHDADFMPGHDHSDPYCTCEVLGRPGSVFKTRVIQDSLDPYWNHGSYMPDYVVGDVLVCTVWDSDGSKQDLNATRLRHQSSGRGSMFDVGDDMLGRIMLTEDDLREPSCREYRLEDSRGSVSFLTVELETRTAWPQLLGRSKVDASYEIERAAPGYRVQVVEQADVGSKIVSWDPVHMQGGYNGKFFGAYVDTIGKFDAGDTILVGNVRYTFDKVSGQRGETGGRKICYIYVRENLQGPVLDGTFWKKVTSSADAGFHGDRILVYFDAVTSKVSQIPYIG